MRIWVLRTLDPENVEAHAGLLGARGQVPEQVLHEQRSQHSYPVPVQELQLAATCPRFIAPWRPRLEVHQAVRVAVQAGAPACGRQTNCSHRCVLPWEILSTTD